MLLACLLVCTIGDQYSTDAAPTLRLWQGGAESAYVELKDHFLNPDIDFRDINLTAPRLSLFLNDCVDGYIENEHLEPRLKIDNVRDSLTHARAQHAGV